MQKDDKGMYVFFGLMIAYLGSFYLGNLYSYTFGLLAKFLIVGTFLVYFKEWFSFKLRFDWLALIAGVGIAALWIFLDPFYPHLHETTIMSLTTLDIILKLVMSVVFASIVEEFFTRYFLHRAIQAKHWLQQPLGVYSLSAFIITTIFFALAHSRWLAGLLAGVILNLLWYKKKDMNSIVLAHALANLFLGLYVLFTGNFSFWF